MGKKKYRDGQKLIDGKPVDLITFRRAILAGAEGLVARGYEHLKKGGRWSDSGLKSFLRPRGYRLVEETDTSVIYRGKVVDRQTGQAASEEVVERLLSEYAKMPEGQQDLGLDGADDEDEEETDRWRWLASTYELQSEVYGYPLDDLADGALPFARDASDRAREIRNERTFPLAHYLDWNVTAAGQELAEIREEFSWKPWATDAPFVNRDRVRDEVVDVLHFLGNILVGIGVTDAELEKAYQEKQARNRARAESGRYSAVKGGIAEGSDV